MTMPPPSSRGRARRPLTAETRVDGTLEAARDAVLRRSAGEPEFQQAVQEVLGSLGPVVAKNPEYVRGKLM
jgi:glutamate dehydrogenase (NADP+)